MSSVKTIPLAGAPPSTRFTLKIALSTTPARESIVAVTKSTASRARSKLLTLNSDISQLPSPRNRAMAGWSAGYQAARVRRQLTPGLISSLPRAAGLPPFISFSTSYHELVFLDAATGLRRSELLALKWGDVEFENLQITVQRSIYRNVVGNCKTEASKKPVPMDPILASELWAWKQHSSYNQPYDWVFASPRTRGKNPYWPDIILTRIVRPAATRAGIQKHVGWHTFRHSFSTIFIGNGENVKVVQELVRHSNCRCTVEIYSQARIQAKRDAQHRVIQMIIPRNGKATDVEER